MPKQHLGWCALAAAISSLTLSACASPVAGLPSIASTQPAEYRIDSGDKLRVAVQDLSNLTADYTVDGTGFVSLPMIKQVSVQGLTLREAELAIESTLREQQILLNPRVSVQPLEMRPIYVMGEVNRPGEYPYRPGMTVFSAASLAGGFTYRAQADTVQVTRTLNGRATTGTATADTPIMPGDRIMVHERWF